MSLLRCACKRFTQQLINTRVDRLNTVASISKTMPTEILSNAGIIDRQDNEKEPNEEDGNRIACESS